MILFGCITFRGRRVKTPNLTVLRCNISAIGGGVSYPEEAKGLAQGRPFRQIKALSGTATGEMDSKEADAVIEPETRGERDIRCVFVSLSTTDS